MDSKFVSYLRAFGVRWFVAMSGPLSVPLAISGFFIQNEVAKLGLFATSLVCAIFASYWIWKVEREARIKAETEINKRSDSKSIRLSLTEFFKQGRDLMYRCNYGDNNTTAEEVNLWITNVIHYLRSDLDETYVERFLDGSGIYEVVPSPIPPPEYQKRFNLINGRVIRLHQFIEKPFYD